MELGWFEWDSFQIVLVDNVGRVEFPGEAESLKEGVEDGGVMGETKGDREVLLAGREGAVKGMAEGEGSGWAGREKLLGLRIWIQLRIV